MNRLAKTVLVGVLLFGPSAFAVTPMERVANVKKLYGDLLFAQARVACDAALQSGDNGPQALARLFRLRGLIAASLSDGAGALSAFKAWTSIDANADLASKRHAPHIRKLFAEAKAWAVGRSIRLQHLPPAGRVKYDGQIGLVGEVTGDALNLVSSAVLYYRWSGQPTFKLQELPLKEGRLSSYWSVDTMKRPLAAESFEYYLEVKDRFGNTLTSAASLEQPLRIAVEFAPQKLPAHRPSVSTSVTHHDAGPAGVAAVVATPIDPVDRSPTRPEVSEPPFYKKWWFWTVVGAVVVGAGVGVGIGLSTNSGYMLDTTVTVDWK